MGSLSNEQLKELTKLVNERLSEFGEKVFDDTTIGIVRLVVDVAEPLFLLERERQIEEIYEHRLREFKRGYDSALERSNNAQEEGYEGDHNPDGHHHFEAVTPKGRTFRVNGDPNMAPETANALGQLMDAAYEQLSTNGHQAEQVSADEDLPIIGAILADSLGASDDDSDGDIAGSDYPPGDDPRFQAVPVSQVKSPVEVVTNGAPDATPAPETPPAPAADDADDDNAADRASLRMGADERAAELRNLLIELQVMSSDGHTMPTMVEWDDKRPKHMSKAQALLKRHNVTWKELAIRARLKMKRDA